MNEFELKLIGDETCRYVNNCIKYSSTQPRVNELSIKSRFGLQTQIVSMRNESGKSYFSKLEINPFFVAIITESNYQKN